jgi:anti-sigma B factor antagonist
MRNELDSRAVESGEALVRRVALSGEIDLSRSEELATVLGPDSLNGSALLEIDLSAVSFMDSHGLRLLLQAHQRAVSAGRRVIIANPSKVVRRLFDVSGVSQVLEVIDERTADQT